MDDFEAVHSLDGIDAACWQEAVQIYNNKQKKSSSGRKRIGLKTGDNCEHDPKKPARELMEAAMRSYEKTKKRDGAFATGLLRIYRGLHQYSRAVDVLVQSYPSIACLVWGSARILLQIGEEEDRASQIACEGILEIIRHAAHWEQVSAFLDLMNSGPLRKELVTLYVAILDFLLSATQWLAQGTPRRLCTSILNSQRDKLAEKLRVMKSASKRVDIELQTQASHEGLGLLREIASDVYVLKDKVDRILEQRQHPSDHTLQLQLDEMLASTNENTTAVRAIASELKRPTTQATVNQVQGMFDLTRMEQWLALGAVEKSPPVPHADGTCHWLLEHPSFLEWSRSEQSPALWVQGHQGCGKSVMAGYLQEHLETKDSSILYYRFQRSASTVESTPTNFASSLILQLLRWTRAYPGTSTHDQLHNLAARFPLGPQECTFKMLWAVATSLLKIPGLQAHLIIDAMDECCFDRLSVRDVSGFLDPLFESIRQTQSKVVIFTRPEPIFDAAVQSGLSIFMDKDFLLPDVMTFAQTEYEKLDLPDTERDEILRLIHSSCHGSFRWTEIFLHYLNQSLRLEDLRFRMRTLPPTISELYRKWLLDGARRLSPDELECRNDLLLAIFKAQKPLRTTEIADAFSLRPEKAEIVISSLCKPLASTYGGFFHLSHPSVREFFELYHQQDDRSLGISFSGSHGVLAEKCLSCLLNKTYADLRRIRSYLIANHDESAQVDNDASPCDGTFYDYAFRFWDYHLVRADAPSKKLLRLVNTFILSLQFTYWSERSRHDCGQLVRVNVAFGSLISWHRGLSREDRSLVELPKYFERAYAVLAGAFASSRMDEILPWLARMTMGDFYFIRLLPVKATWMRQQVLARLQDLLGPRHRLTLRAESDVAYVHLYAGEMRAAHVMYNEVVDIQRQLFGEHSSHFLETLLYKGQSEYYMADFEAAIRTWTTVSAESQQLLGSDSWLFLAAQWWYAQGVAYMGQLGHGLQIFQAVIQKRRELFGPSDSFANLAQINVGEIQLLLGQHQDSVDTLREMIKWRREVYPLSNVNRLDAEITLAIAYQAAGMRRDAIGIVEEIEAERACSRRSRFERYCQLNHLKGVLLAEAGLLDNAIHVLQNVVTQAEEDENNRALLWIRLDLATLLRKRGEKSDRDQASANFDNIVRDTAGDYDSSFADEPDPPRLLVAAEKALRLVRARKHIEARRELESEHLDWRRPSDFWLWVGGTFNKDLLQITDTAFEGST